MIPLLDLTHNLAASTAGNLTTTVLTTPKNQSYLAPLLSAHPSTIHPLLLPFPSHPSLPPGVENAKDMPDSLRTIILSFSNLHHPLLRWFRSHPSPPQFIISDMFCGWTQNLASQLQIRRIVFSPSGAFAYSTFCYLWKHFPKRQNETDENEVVSYHDLPNSPKYAWWQVSPLFRSYVAGDHDERRRGSRRTQRRRMKNAKEEDEEGEERILGRRRTLISCVFSGSIWGKSVIFLIFW